MHELSQAKTSKSIARFRERYSDAKEARTICVIQLRTKVVPWSCYHLVRLERSWNLPSSFKQIFLDDQCRVAAAGTLSGTLDRLDFSDAELSSYCRMQVEKAREIVLYRNPNRNLENFSNQTGPEIEINDDL
jgi:hypothetical protein